MDVTFCDVVSYIDSDAFLFVDYNLNHNFFSLYSNILPIKNSLRMHVVREFTSHSLFGSDHFKFVDDYKFYGLEDYSLRLAHFSSYNIVQFFCLRSGFNLYLGNLVSKYLGFSSQLNIEQLKNY
jgi:hypothetical protein